MSVLPRDLEHTARTCHGVERLRNVPSSANLLRVILAYAVSDLSLKDTAAWAKATGIADFTGQAFHYRLQKCEKWLEHLLGQLLFRDPPQNPSSFPIRVVDGSVITGPGSKGTDWVAHMIVDPASGQFTSVEVTDCRGAETYTRHPVNPGESTLGDRMYATARGIEYVVNRKAHPLVRVNPYNLKICDLNRQRIHLESYEARVLEKGIISLDVLIPTPPDNLKKNRPWKLKNAKSWIPARIVGGRTKKGVIWVLTTLSREQLSDEGVLKLYRFRRQIELLFKRLKSLLHLDELPTRDGPISKSWLLGRLLAAAIAQTLVNPAGPFPRRGRPQRRRISRQSQCLVKIQSNLVGTEVCDLWRWSLASDHQGAKPQDARWFQTTQKNRHPSEDETMTGKTLF
ncbi:MAG: transposase [Desulfomonilaceae bacterium]|nr:transposase [Desulfomonilaceae bacterium]